MTEVPGTIAALRFMQDNQLLLHHVEDGVERLKYIPPEAARAAWAEVGIDTGWLDSGVVRYGANRQGTWSVRFIRPVRPQIVQFTTSEGEPEIPASISLTLPPLVLVGANGSYYLFATRESEFSPDAPAFVAPFPNIHANGQICFGANPQPAFAEAGMRRALQLFCEAPFTQSYANDKSASEPRDVRRALVRHARRGADTPYPLEDLIVHPTSRTIGELVEGLVAS